MACAACGKNKNHIGITNSSNIYPFDANDIKVIENNEIHRFAEGDWDNSATKLLICVPAAFTPVCESELGAMKKWYQEFKNLNCELIMVCTDTPPMLQDWIASEPSLENPPFKIFSSYILPNRLGITENGRCKRSSVFVTTTGEVVKQEHFDKVGRSFAELHRMLYGFNQDSYCAEGWQSPEDGFLEP